MFSLLQGGSVGLLLTKRSHSIFSFLLIQHLSLVDMHVGCHDDWDGLIKINCEGHGRTVGCAALLKLPMKGYEIEKLVVNEARKCQA